MNGYNPRLYYENYNALVLKVDTFKCLFEIHSDGAYISHTFSDILWIKLLGEAPQSGKVALNDNNVEIITISIYFVDKI
jgi:hypothetical protein